MVNSNIEKKTSLWLGMFVVVMSIVYIFVSLGKTNWIEWIALIWGLFLGVFLLLEAKVLTYFAKKDYKKIGFGDAVVIGSLIFGIVIILNSLLLIGAVKDLSPAWLISFGSTTGVVAGVIGALLGILHIAMPRFK